jgi:hypothetical protein
VVRVVLVVLAALGFHSRRVRCEPMVRAAPVATLPLPSGSPSSPAVLGLMRQRLLPSDTACFFSMVRCF